MPSADERRHRTPSERERRHAVARDRSRLKVVALTVLTIVAVVIVVFIGFQTSPGKKLLVAAINRTMAGEARVRGLSGAVPWDMAIAEIELEDPLGTHRRCSVQG